MDFGAVKDGKTLNTKSIQNAIDKCNAYGGGVVYFPAGKYLSGCITIKSNVTVHFENGSVILGSTNVNDFPILKPELKKGEATSNRSLIYADRANNIAVIGNGIIDGQGYFYNTPEQSKSRPALLILYLVECKNVKIIDITLKDSPTWVSLYELCNNMVIDGITVNSRKFNNNDGIDLDDCSDVRITNCKVFTQDDALCLKSSTSASCKNIVIDNCILSSNCNAFKMGTSSYGGYQNIVFSNSIIHNTWGAGISIISADGGFVRNVMIDNIVMDTVNEPFYIRICDLARTFKKGDISKPIGDVLVVE